MWSIQTKTGAAARKQLVELLPPLLRSIDWDWPTNAEAQARQQALLSCLLDLHLRSIKAVHDAAAAVLAGATALPAAAAVAPATAAALPEPDEYDEQVQSLVRGDWCEFKSEDGKTELARLAWRAPQRQRLLFSRRDGSTAFVYTPEGLAEAFRSGRVTLAIEAAPLFERAMTRLVVRRSQSAEAGAATAAS